MLDITAMDALPQLTEDEIKRCRQSFGQFDKDQSGTIDIKELRTAMQGLGQNPSDEELFVMISLSRRGTSLLVSPARTRFDVRRSHAAY